MKNLKVHELQLLAEERYGDAKELYHVNRYGGAFYLCGYAIEFGLKKKICATLGWDEYTGDGKYKFLKTHDFEILLHFSGVEREVKTSFWSEWSAVTKWNPEKRYSSVKPTEQDVKLLLDATETLLRIL
ncbi:MAG: HEPN domain-containing protein [Verrucomicrobiota bacterium]|nr:HEPN domain-containing protein [Verrucomicrobiota bacterium]